MRLGVIGAGMVGVGVARLRVEAGLHVMIAKSRGPESLASISADLGCKAGTVQEVIEAAELALVAIPLSQITALPADICADKIALDANNYYPERDGSLAELDQRQITTSELLAQRLSHAVIVKAFNAILARDLQRHARPAGRLDRRALPIARNDAAAQAKVTELLDQLGYDAVDAGPLNKGWWFERAEPVYGLPFGSAAMRDALTAATEEDEASDVAWRTQRDIQVSLKASA